MSERTALVAAIISDPDDDTPRLVFADWLQEQGEDERAWLIRFQCDPKNQRVHDGTREYALIERHVEEWFGLSTLTGRKRNRLHHDWYLRDHGPPNLYFRCGREWVELPIRRGFITEAQCSASWWLTHADSFHWHPTQTVMCPECQGRSPRWKMREAGQGKYDFCETCRNKGRVPRPCSETAQPMRKVELTDLHSTSNERDEYDRVWALVRKHGLDWRPGDEPERWLRVFRAEWPGVEFLSPVDLYADFRRAGQRIAHDFEDACIQAFLGEHSYATSRPGEPTTMLLPPGVDPEEARQVIQSTNLAAAEADSQAFNRMVARTMLTTAPDMIALVEADPERYLDDQFFGELARAVIARRSGR